MDNAVLEEEPREATIADVGAHFHGYAGMIVANAACVDCEAPYLAWIDGRWKGWPRPRWEDGKIVPSDLSHRSTFNDEPGVSDYPKHVIRTVRERQGPWPRCDYCGAPMSWADRTRTICHREHEHPG